ncbi:MAG: methyltransferase domain-containing protein, partial [Sciscionella sp.]
MLDRLDVHDGHRVLEIGTGSGYNAALLCCRVGEDRVHSVDIDATFVTQAAEHLSHAGYHPQVSATNGAALPDDHTYDRIIATCAIDEVPSSWVRQLTTGGRLLAPMSCGGALAVLDKTSDDTLTGYVDSAPVYFMPLRDAPEQLLPAHVAFPLPPLPPATECHRGTTDIDPRIAENRDFQLWFALHLLGSQVTHSYTSDGTVTSTIVYTPQDRATARYQPSSGGLWPVTQHGQRLWDTVEAAAHAWRRNGEPKRARLGITVRDGDNPAQYAWLDSPDSEYAWPLK